MGRDLQQCVYSRQLKRSHDQEFLDFLSISERECALSVRGIVSPLSKAIREVACVLSTPSCFAVLITCELECSARANAGETLRGIVRGRLRKLETRGDHRIVRVIDHALESHPE